jgi:glycosyltransferase involved in cell wall biosynthesis
VNADHIAIVMHDFSTGGSERIAIRLANQWVRNGRRVTIMCGTTDGPARTLIKPGVGIRRVDTETVRGFLSRIRFAKRLVRDIEMLAPDLIFAPGNFHFPVLVALRGFMRSARPAMVCKLSNPLFGPSRWFKKLFVGRIDAFVAMSDALAVAARRTLGNVPIATIREPILDANAVVSTADRTSKLVVCAGRLVEQKNFSLAIDAFRTVNFAEDMRMLILGDGPQRRKLERRIRRRGLARQVRLGGHVPDIGPVLAEARLLLMTSEYEGYPAVLVEALARGVPVVTTDCSPAIREIMADPSFGRVDPSTPRALAAGMASVIAGEMPDPAALDRLTSHLRIDTVAAHYLMLFDDIVSARRHSSNMSDAGDETIHDRLPVPNESRLAEAHQHTLS